MLHRGWHTQNTISQIFFWIFDEKYRLPIFWMLSYFLFLPLSSLINPFIFLFNHLCLRWDPDTRFVNMQGSPWSHSLPTQENVEGQVKCRKAGRCVSSLYIHLGDLCSARMPFLLTFLPDFHCSAPGFLLPPLHFTAPPRMQCISTSDPCCLVDS